MKAIRISDDGLMAASARGDRDAFEQLVIRHEKPLVNFFRRMGALSDEAEDLAQETFLRVFAWRNRYRQEGRFKSFMYSIARNAWADLGRKAMRRPRTVADSADLLAPKGRDIEAALDAQAALEGLSEKLRETVVLAVCQDLNHLDVAEILGVPVGTVKSRVHMAIRNMREALRADTRER